MYHLIIRDYAGEELHTYNCFQSAVAAAHELEQLIDYDDISTGWALAQIVDDDNKLADTIYNRDYARGRAEEIESAADFLST